MSAIFGYIFLFAVIYNAFGWRGVYAALYTWQTQLSFICSAVVGVCLDFIFGFHDQKSLGVIFNYVPDIWAGLEDANFGMIILMFPVKIFLYFNHLALMTLISFTPFCTLFLIFFIYFAVVRWHLLFRTDEVRSSSGSAF